MTISEAFSAGFVFGVVITGILSYLLWYFSWKEIDKRVKEYEG